MQKATSQGSFPKKRAAKKNKAVCELFFMYHFAMLCTVAAEKMGIYKRRFEDMKSFLRRVEKTTFRAVQDHKMKVCLVYSIPEQMFRSNRGLLLVHRAK